LGQPLLTQVGRWQSIFAAMRSAFLGPRLARWDQRCTVSAWAGRLGHHPANWQWRAIGGSKGHRDPKEKREENISCIGHICRDGNSPTAAGVRG
jgi:hypothetical protein